MVKEFPDKILLVKDDIDDIVQDYWVLRNLTQCKDSEYIRKDVVDDMLKTAEDHAYFAGSEAMREKLIEKACDAYCRFCGHDAIKSENYKCRQDCGYYKAFRKTMEG